MKIDQLRELYEKDQYQEFLNAIVSQGSNLASELETLKGLIYSSADLDIHGFKADYKKAFESFEKAAKLGDGEAMLELAKAYYYGDGVEESYSDAYRWFKSAYEFGVDQALNELANFLYDHPEEGGEKECVHMLENMISAQDVNLSAYVKLGRIYIRGSHGVSPDYEKAVDYLNIASKSGNKNANMDLAILYLKGIGVERDLYAAKRLVESCSDHINYDDLLAVINDEIRSN